MRKDFVTKFWQNAYEKLPEGVRGQYLTQMKAAESWELTIGDLIKVGARVKGAISRAFHAPRTKRA